MLGDDSAMGLPLSSKPVWLQTGRLSETEWATSTFWTAPEESAGVGSAMAAAPISAMAPSDRQGRPRRTQWTNDRNGGTGGDPVGVVIASSCLSCGSSTVPLPRRMAPVGPVYFPLRHVGPRPLPSDDGPLPSGGGRRSAGAGRPESGSTSRVGWSSGLHRSPSLTLVTARTILTDREELHETGSWAGSNGACWPSSHVRSTRSTTVSTTVSARLDEVQRRVAEAQAVVEATAAGRRPRPSRPSGVVESDARTASRFEEIERMLGAAPPGTR